MTVSISGRHVELTKDQRDHIEAKLPRLAKYTARPQDVNFTVSKDAYNHVVELRVMAGAQTVIAKQKDPDAMRAFDHVLDKVEAQLKKAHDRKAGARKHAGDTAKRTAPGTLDPAAPDADDVTTDRAGLKVMSGAKRKGAAAPAESVAARAKNAATAKPKGGNGGADAPLTIDKIGLRVFEAGPVKCAPMDVEDAAEALFFEDENFLCFTDRATGGLAVMYRRKDGHFAVMRPGSK